MKETTIIAIEALLKADDECAPELAESVIDLCRGNKTVGVVPKMLTVQQVMGLFASIYGKKPSAQALFYLSRSGQLPRHKVSYRQSMYMEKDVHDFLMGNRAIELMREKKSRAHTGAVGKCWTQSGQDGAR